MARRDPPRLPEKVELVASLDRSRAALSRELLEVGRVLDFPSQFRTSYATGQWRWLAGALAAGVATGLLLPLGRGVTGTLKAARPVSSALLGAVARSLLASAAEPALMRLAGDQIDKWITAVLRKT